MLHSLNIRVERDVLRFEAEESRRFATVPATMLVNTDGMILRAGIRPQEWEEIRTSEDVVVPAQLRFTRVFDEERDPAVCANFFHHVMYEFLQQIRDESGRGFWFSDRVACRIDLSTIDDPEFVRLFADQLRRIPLFQSCSINGVEQFSKGARNLPVARFFTITATLVAATALIVIPLFAIDAAVDRHPAWRRAFLGGLALAFTAAATGFVLYEKKRGRIGTRMIVFVAAITALAVLRLLSEASQ